MRFSALPFFLEEEYLFVTKEKNSQFDVVLPLTKFRVTVATSEVIVLTSSLHVSFVL